LTHESGSKVSVRSNGFSRFLAYSGLLAITAAIRSVTECRFNHPIKLSESINRFLTYSAN
jgi:hypothetical protein